VKRKRVTMRKYLGDDLYSWAVFVDGRPVLTGLSRSEAQYHVKAERGWRGITE